MNAEPSIDPANEGSQEGMLRQVLRKSLQATDDMLPCRVVAFSGDREKPRVTVQPLVALMTTVGQTVARAQIASIPVFQFGAGGFILSTPVKPGDLGWVKANDRDISLLLQTFESGPPNTMRMHSFEDAVFFPDAMRGYTIDGADQEAVVLQSLDGAVRVSVAPAQLTLTAPGCVIGMVAGVISLTGTSVIVNGIPFETHGHTGVLAGPSETGGPVAL